MDLLGALGHIALAFGPVDLLQLQPVSPDRQVQLRLEYLQHATSLLARRKANKGEIVLNLNVGQRSIEALEVFGDEVGVDRRSIEAKKQCFGLATSMMAVISSENVNKSTYIFGFVPITLDSATIELDQAGN